MPASVLGLTHALGMPPLAPDTMLALAASLLLAGGPVLAATVQVVPSRFVSRKDKVELIATLTNITDRPVSVLTGHTGSENYFFALQLQDKSGKVIWDGDAVRFVNTSDLPVGTFATLAPHGQYKAILDWRYLYNLAPGSYKLSVIYRVEPDKEPHAAGLYAGEIRAHHAFVGRVQSSSVEIECKVR